MNDTIFAPATAPGRAALAVVRISGPAAAGAVAALAGRLPAPRRASLRKLRNASGDVIDEGLVLWFPGPASYSGEDCAEVHLHGGLAVVDSLVETLVAQGLRLAEPGEFTRRAFQNGRLDLAQAEAVADLIDAETAAQSRQALDQLGGGLSRRYEGWRALLIEAMAGLEAAVDFPDEDLPEDVAARARPHLNEIHRDLVAAVADVDRGRRVREGFRIALIGAPNAGKSSLLNRLVEREAAIVTATPGTTRDIIEAPLVLRGYKTLLADTAGVRDTVEAIEAEGVRRALAWGRDADLRLWIVDAAAAEDRWQEAEALIEPGDILVLNKSDLVSAPNLGAARIPTMETVRVSATTGRGLDALRALLESRVVAALSGGDFPAATRLRHAESLREASALVERALAQPEPELAAEDVRLAARALERISGRVDAEAVLDRVFASFCIGK
ncbi:MAG: tRNA uridine-5-carboxymethylaminomethyl(34) synthesis GTPase MnmE [Caulobacter sp.]|nr:tRNA uridine-5-carboxymethylaminomethyl(34) synthesis GTPase MnmE [Caulobacter sp.]